MELSRQNRQFIKSIALIAMLFTVPLTSTAQTSAKSDSLECAKRIESTCRHLVFTVAATTPAAESQDRVSERKWQKNIGTAVPVSADGYLITAHSVVKDAADITLTNCEGIEYTAVLVGCDITGRIAVMKIDAELSGMVPAVINLGDIKEGSRAFSFGVVPGMTVDVTCGMVKHLHHHDGAIEIVSSRFSGTSGTPVFDTDENLIGLLAYKVDSESSSSNSSQPDTYIALSFDYATVLARRVIEENIPKCGWLGICIDLANSNTGGIYIKDIIKGSPAEHAKILPNDIIYEYNGAPASTINSFSEAFGKSKAGEQVTIKLLRGGSRISVDVTLSER